jgi:hypothetical protein
MIGGDYCWRLEHGARIADCKQGRKLFAGEHFRIGDHYPNMHPYGNSDPVSSAQIDE